MIHIKTEEEITLMRESGKRLAEVLEIIKKAVLPGVKLFELDGLAKKEILKRGCKPSFKGYTTGEKVPPFPAYLCASVNNELVHAPASRALCLKEGDIIGLDLGLTYQGWHSDMAETIPVGSISKEAKRLLIVTKESLKKGIAAARAGASVRDIGKAVYEHVEANKLGVVTSFVGHGIGKELHEEPAVPNYPTEKSKKIKLKVGMVLAIEPMVTIGEPELTIADDGWTAVTKSGKYAAHFEHTVAITEKGPQILTRL